MSLVDRALATPDRFRAVTAATIVHDPAWSRMPPDLREAVEVVSRVLPFRTNEYVLRELIDWDDVPADPMFRLTFPQREMLAPADYARIHALVSAGRSREEVRRAANTIRLRLNPHPSGQREHNVPQLAGRSLPGLQHKYRETVLFFPSQGQTCHAYCTYCFRWAQFVNLPELRFATAETEPLVSYLRAHPEISDVLFTGGDPMIMSASNLRGYVEPLLAPELDSVRSVRIGTKAPAYWPYRFVSDPDADDVLRLFDDVVASGRHLAVMVHYSHPAELGTEVAAECLRRIRATGAEVRLQAPLVRHVNDHADVWAELCTRAVALGVVPYYQFIERDTGPRRYFELPLVEAHRIYAGALRQVSGLARTLRGPIMSTTAGKVRVLGTVGLPGSERFVLDYVQARDPGLVGRPFFAALDPAATWFDELVPAGDEDRPFFGSVRSP